MVERLPSKQYVLVRFQFPAQTAVYIPEPKAASVADIAAVYFGGCDGKTNKKHYDCHNR